MAVPVFTDQVAFATDPIAAYVDQILGLGPEVYLRLGDTVGSGTAADASGLGNTGSVAGGVTFGTAGLLSGDAGTCAAFDGSSGTISVANSATWVPTTALTIAAWIDTATLASNQDILQCGQFILSINASSDCIAYQVNDAALFSASVSDSAHPLSTSTVYFFVVTDDGTTITIYQNGVQTLQVLRSTLGLSTGFRTNGSPLRIGSGTGGGTPWFNGNLQEVAVFKDAVLTAAQIAQLYSARTVQNPTVWTTLTGRPKTIGVTRGKQHELDQIQTGSADSQLLNLDRALDPTNTASAYWPNVKPLRKFRRRATINSTTYSMFAGFVTRWPQSRQGRTYADVKLQAVDGFELLNAAIITGSFPQELSGARVARILNLANWPQADRNIDPGGSLVSAIAFVATDKKTALSHLQDVEASERGLFFIAGNGQATFIDRHSRLVTPYNTSQGIFSDSPGGGEFGYTDIQTSYDRDQIFNDWTDTRAGGTAQNAQDPASNQSYLRRSQSLTSLLASDVDSAYSVAWLLSLYKDPLFRVDSITLKPGSSTAYWQAVLAREIGDRVTVKGTPPGGGPQFVKDCFIAQMTFKSPEHPGNAEITWQLTSADNSNYLIFDDATFGQFDGNKVAW